MHIFTFVASYQGTTYITQFQGATPRAALREWLRSFSFSIVEGLSPSELYTLKRDLSAAVPRRADSFRSMWFLNCMLGKDGFGIDIIDTKTK